MGHMIHDGSHDRSHDGSHDRSQDGSQDESHDNWCVSMHKKPDNSNHQVCHCHLPATAATLIMSTINARSSPEATSTTIPVISAIHL